MSGLQGLDGADIVTPELWGRMDILSLAASFVRIASRHLISRANISALLLLNGPGAEEIDLSSKVEIAPVCIPPNMPLPFI